MSRVIRVARERYLKLVSAIETKAEEGPDEKDGLQADQRAALEQIMLSADDHPVLEDCKEMDEDEPHFVLTHSSEWVERWQKRAVKDPIVYLEHADRAALVYKLNDSHDLLVFFAPELWAESDRFAQSILDGHFLGRMGLSPKLVKAELTELDRVPQFLSRQLKNREEKAKLTAQWPLDRVLAALTFVRPKGQSVFETHFLNRDESPANETHWLYSVVRLVEQMHNCGLRSPSYVEWFAFGIHGSMLNPMAWFSINFRGHHPLYREDTRRYYENMVEWLHDSLDIILQMETNSNFTDDQALDILKHYFGADSLYKEDEQKPEWLNRLLVEKEARLVFSTIGIETLAESYGAFGNSLSPLIPDILRLASVPTFVRPSPLP